MRRSRDLVSQTYLLALVLHRVLPASLTAARRSAALLPIFTFGFLHHVPLAVHLDVLPVAERGFVDLSVADLGLTVDLHLAVAGQAGDFPSHLPRDEHGSPRGVGEGKALLFRFRSSRVFRLGVGLGR